MLLYHLSKLLSGNDFNKITVPKAKIVARLSKNVIIITHTLPDILTKAIISAALN